MSEYEDLAERREDEAEALESDAERLERHIKEAKDAASRAESDPLIPTPAPEDPGEEDPEADYPTKD